MSGTSSGTISLTFGNSGAMAGGSGPVYVWQNFRWSNNGQNREYFAGNLYNMSGSLARMIATGQPIL
jgi:hypothetical protein